MFTEHDPYPPFISPRSPSYERAWREFPHPSADAHANTVALLGRLSEAEQNASNLCARMVPQVDPDFAEILRDRGELHHARREALGKLIERFGGAALTDAECRTILTRTRDAVDLVASTSDAKRALTILRDELSAEYRTALESDGLEEPQRSSLAALAPA